MSGSGHNGELSTVTKYLLTPEDIDKKSRVAVVTGASRGIGRAVSLGLARSGLCTDLIITCLERSDLLSSLAEEIMSTCHVKVTALTGDSGSFDFAHKCMSGLDRLDILINNSGTSYMGLLSDMTDSDWRNVLSSDLDSVFNFCNAAIPVMLKNHSGRIINISSVWGDRGASNEVAYSAAKGAVNSLTRGLARELAPSGISVNAIAPGLIDTDMNSSLSKEELKALIDQIPAGRMGTPEDISGAVIALLNMPVYVTGQIIAADGGWI